MRKTEGGRLVSVVRTNLGQLGAVGDRGQTSLHTLICQYLAFFSPLKSYLRELLATCWTWPRLTTLCRLYPKERICKPGSSLNLGALENTKSFSVSRPPPFAQRKRND